MNKKLNKVKLGDSRIMKVLLIIPAYNEALNIEKTVKDVKTNTKFDML